MKNILFALFAYLFCETIFCVAIEDGQVDEAIRWGFLKLDEDMTLG
jgi:hypothetical protein